jgi:3-dehydrotetronate 4-kinase
MLKLEGEAMLFGCVADDLTGAVEIASMLVAQGVRTAFSIGPNVPQVQATDAHVVALKSRVAPVAEAVSDVVAAASVLRRNGSKQLFFKYCATFDSTPKGNIGPCAEALLDLVGSDFTIFAPSFCEVGRTVYQGHMFAGPQLLSDSPKRFDPLTPMTDSNLLRVLDAQTTKKVGLLPHQAIHAGSQAVRRRIAELREDGTAFAIADAIYEADLAVLARSCADLPLLTGNSSIAAHLPRVWREERLLQADTSVDPLPGISGNAAILVGSCAERTAAQLAYFEQSHPVLRLDLADVFAGEDLVKRAMAWAAQHIDNGPIAVSTAADTAEVARLQDRHGRLEVAGRAEAILSDLASALVERFQVRRLIVAGGETSGAVLNALGIDRLQIGPYEGPGIARVFAHDPKPMALLLKSGKLGSLDIFEAVLGAMQHAIRPEHRHATWLDA